MGRFLDRRRFVVQYVNQGVSDTTAPTATITALSAVANVVAMQIVWSEVVVGFAVGDITISAGGSLASFATVDNITFTVSWTLANDSNTMDIAGGVCQDAAGNNNTAATQYVMIYTTLQPDATAGKDVALRGDAPTVNYGVSAALPIGCNGGASKFRGLIQFDLSGVAAGSTVYSAIMSLKVYDDGTTITNTYRIYRLKRVWVEGTRDAADDSPATGATWQRYDTTNTWQTQGGFGANDCEQTDIGSRAMSAAETLNTFLSWTLTAASIQEMIPSGAWNNNGFLIKGDDETNANYYQFRTSDYATAGDRPKLEVVYHPNP
jgi:hypothetical protein